MQTKFSIDEFDRLIYNKILFYLDTQKYRVNRKDLKHTVEYWVYQNESLIGIFKITQTAEGITEYTGNGANNNNAELSQSWVNLYYKIILPIIKQEEQLIDNIPSTPTADKNEYKDFSFRLSKATIKSFCWSVQTAKVAEKIETEAHSNYGVEFYSAGYDSVDFCVGINSSMLPPTRKYEILRFQFTPIGDGLRVNVHYRNFEMFYAYFVGLFSEIAKDWTDAQPEINKVIAELTGIAVDQYESETNEFMRKLTGLNPPAGSEMLATILADIYSGEQSQNSVSSFDEKEKSEKTKQKGRYRLTPEEIKNRKEIVKKAKKIKKDNPSKLWKQIATELEIPERTLRDYRHNPIYD